MFTAEEDGAGDDTDCEAGAGLDERVREAEVRLSESEVAGGTDGHGARGHGCIASAGRDWNERASRAGVGRWTRVGVVRMTEGRRRRTTQQAW